MTSLDATDSWYFLPTRNSNDAELGAVAMLVWDGLLEAWTRRLRFDFDGVPRLRARPWLRASGFLSSGVLPFSRHPLADAS